MHFRLAPSLPGMVTHTGPLTVQAALLWPRVEGELQVKVQVKMSPECRRWRGRKAGEPLFLPSEKIVLGLLRAGGGLSADGGCAGSTGLLGRFGSLTTSRSAYWGFPLSTLGR